jgi:hypothetical protein
MKLDAGSGTNSMKVEKPVENGGALVGRIG